MRLGLRLLFGFFVIAGLAAFFVLRVFVTEIKPSVREVMEDVLIDTANLLAEQVAPELRVLPAGATLAAGSAFARAVAGYAERPVDARIWGLHERALDMRVYVTDRTGRVVFDSGTPPATGADYARWNDVARTLRGEYGARATREVAGDDRSSVMYVAAPVSDERGAVIGVLTVAKPLAAVQPFVERAERKILVAGAWLLGLSLAIGIAVTAWTVHSVRTLRRYAQHARAGERQPLPALPGELGELAQAMGEMRERVEGRAEVERSVRALTHELKSPLTAIRGAGELLGGELAPAERTRFSRQIDEQAERLQTLVERLLELSKLEGRSEPVARTQVMLAEALAAAFAAEAPLLDARGLRVQWRQRDAVTVQADAEALALALANLVVNAAHHAPAGSTLEAAVQRDGAQAVLTLRDHGPGVPAYALPQLGNKFFSLPRPSDGRKGSGLGLAIVRQVIALHGGSISFEPQQPGLRVRVTLPAAA
jgi:two-component system sensor histidine kinase CreC